MVKPVGNQLSVRFTAAQRESLEALLAEPPPELAMRGLKSLNELVNLAVAEFLLKHKSWRRRQEV